MLRLVGLQYRSYCSDWDCAVQCCGSQSDLVPFLPLDPGSGMGKKSGSGSGMNNQDLIS
jgi:hypothetical protein